MAAGPHTFMTLVVFSAEKFQGNPLAVVAVRGNALTDARKSLIAKEFGYAETVFLHDALGPGQPRRLDIYTGTGEELPFAGHPVIGTAHYIFCNIERLRYRSPSDRDNQRQSAVLSTKAGLIPITFNPYRQVAACAVPQTFHVHNKKLSLDEIIVVQPQIRIVPTIKKLREKTFPVVSIVKGMTFALIDLTDAPEVLAALAAAKAPAVELDADWTPSFVGCMYFKRTSRNGYADQPAIHALQARMITQGFEDPGTGSACSALAAYLSLHESKTYSSNPPKHEPSNTDEELASKTTKIKLEDGEKQDKAEDDKRQHIFAIEQGIEMGRKCTIAVEVDVDRQEDGERKIASIVLSGRANFMLKGELLGA